MPLQLVLGPSASGKSSLMAQKIQRILEDDPSARILYLVPEQSSMEIEERMLSIMPSQSLMTLEVLSFKRLSYRIFQETGFPQKLLLDDVGKCMLLYRVAKEKEKELTFYQSSLSSKGFLGQMKLMLTEIIQYGIDEEKLQKAMESQPPESSLAHKLHDISLLWKGFREALGDTMLAVEETGSLLAEHIAKSQVIPQTHILIDGFTGFTPQQYIILQELMLHAKSLSMALTMPEKAYLEAKAVGAFERLPSNLFYTPQKTYLKTTALAKSLSVPVEETFLQDTFQAPLLSDFTTELLLSHRKASFFPQDKREDQLYPLGAYLGQNLKDEIHALMETILYLVREKGYRLCEIRIIVPDLEDYRGALEKALSLYAIPYYMDDNFDVITHPYGQYLQAVNEMVLSGYRLDEFLGFLKAGLYQIDADILDRIENTAIKENWQGIGRIQKGLDAFSEETKIGDYFREFTGGLSEAKLPSDYHRVYTTLTRQLGVRETLEEMAKESEAEKNLQKALHFRKVYDQAETMMIALENMVEKGREKPYLSIKSYVNLLETGLSQLKLGQPPMASDVLFVGTIGRSQIESSKVLIFGDFSGGKFPKASGETGLLSPRERMALSEQFEVAKGQNESIMEQYYLLYLLMGKARDAIYFFASTADPQGGKKGLSPVFGRLKAILPHVLPPADEHHLTMPRPMIYDNDRALTREQLSYLEEKAFYHAFPLGDWDYGWQSDLGTKELLDPTLRELSITQLEKYAQCPFSYYLHYGLGALEREAPKVTALEDGSVFHAFLEAAGDAFSKALTYEEALALTRDIAEQSQERFEVYQTSSRFRYFWEKLQRNAARAIEVISDQLSQTDFQVKETEWAFGGKGKTGALAIQLKDGTKVKIQGIIDRIDVWEQEAPSPQPGEGSAAKPYIRIIDYKSGSTSFDPAKLQAGLQLQLPIYLKASSEKLQAEAAGFFYFHLLPPLKEEKKAIPPYGSKESHEKLMARMKLEGVLLDHQEIAFAMDHRLREEGKAVSISAELRDGALDSKELVSKDQMNAIKRFAEEKAAELSEGIQAGEIEASPSTQSAQSAALFCEYCEYRRSCPLESAVRKNRARKVEACSLEDLVAQMEKKEKEHLTDELPRNP